MIDKDIIEVNENIEPKEIKRKSPFKMVIFFIVIVLVLFYSYIRFIEPKLLIIKEYAIIDNKIPSSFNGLKIVNFSDIFYGSSINEKSLKNIVAKINDLKPDIVIFNGDLFNNSINLNSESKNVIKDILKDIKATFKKYAVLGDQDYTNKFDFMEIMEYAEFMVLNNKNDFLFYNGNDPIEFIGTTSSLNSEFDLESALNTPNNNEFAYKIWIHHEPIILDTIKEIDNKPNVVFTSHTLKGLINLFDDYYLLKQEGINNYTKDYYEINDTKMYVNSGLGTLKFNVRFLNPPSISLYRLYQS